MRMYRACWGLLSLALWLWPRQAAAQECANAATEHPEWILCEDWESGTIPGTVWNDVNGDNQVVTSPAPNSGTYSLDMTHPAGASGGYLNSIWYWTGYTQLHDRGFQRLFVRWYVRFDADFGSSTKIAGFTVKASDLPGFWDGFVGAGFKPDGAVNGGGSRMVTARQGDTYPGVLRFYTYHLEMMLDRWSNNGTDVQCKYYGDSKPPPAGWVQTDTTLPDNDYYCSAPGTSAWDELSALLSGYDPGTYREDVVLAAGGDWTCIEQEMRVNDQGAADGVLRFWVKDQLIGEWFGLRFGDDATQMNIHALQLTASSGTSHGVQHSYYDDIVVSTSRIGCDGSGGGDDAGPGPGDAGVPGADGGNGASGDESAGCGCVVGDSVPSAPGPLLLLVGVLLVCVRRRRARR